MNEETRASDLYYILLVIFLIIVTSLATLGVRYYNSNKLDEDLQFVTNVIKMKDKIELREDIISITLHGKAVHAKVDNTSEYGNDYDSTTLVGSGYAIKSDGTVILDKSQKEIYKIETAPEDNKTNKLFWWFMHSYLW